MSPIFGQNIAFIGNQRNHIQSEFETINAYCTSLCIIAGYFEAIVLILLFFLFQVSRQAHDVNVVSTRTPFPFFYVII